MEEYARTSIRIREKSEDGIAEGSDNDQQLHTLRKLQRGLAERIRKTQCDSLDRQLGGSA